MAKGIAVACLAGLLATLVLPAAYAQTQILGTAQINQAPSWFVDARWFDRDSPVGDWQDNRTYSMGYNGVINDKTEFGIAYSAHKSVGIVDEDAIRLDRKVLSPSLKRLISAPGKNSALAVTVGADIALGQGRWTNLDSGQYANAKDFTLGAKMQLEWGQPGDTQYQLAAAIAGFDSKMRRTGYYPYAQDSCLMDGFGTITALGGGVVYPFSKATFVGDVLVPIDGDNVITDDGYLDDKPVWSAGFRWGLGDRWNSNVCLYATNSMGPTLASSLLASPDSEIGYGLTYTRGF